jgi:hypothetical protein
MKSENCDQPSSCLPLRETEFHDFSCFILLEVGQFKGSLNLDSFIFFSLVATKAFGFGKCDVIYN